MSVYPELFAVWAGGDRKVWGAERIVIGDMENIEMQSVFSWRL